MSILNRMNNWSESTLGFILWVCSIVGPPIGIAFHCVYQVSIGNGHEQFRLAFVDVPKEERGSGLNGTALSSSQYE